MTVSRLFLFFLILSSTSFALVQAQDDTPEAAPEAITTPDSPPTQENAAPEVTTPAATETGIPAAEEITTEKEKDTPEEKTAETPKKKEKQKEESVLSNNKPGVVSDEEIAPIKSKLKKDKADKVSPETYVQQSERYKLPDNYKSLDLNVVIEQGLRENHQEKIRDLKREVFEIQKQSAHTSFWLPHVQLQLTTDEQRLGTIWKGNKSGEGASTSPAGSFGLSLGDYTVFNWGKDYLQYLNTTRELTRNSEVLSEERRNLRHQLITNFFEVVTAKNIERVMKNQLRQASFIFRLNKEKVSVGKASKQEYYESRAQYLKAQRDLQEASINTEVFEGTLSNLLQDPHGVSYIVNQDILFQRISVPLDEALGIGKVKSSAILDAKSKLEIAEHSYQLAAKESLPLPRLSVNLGAYTNHFSKNGSSTTYETRPNNSDIELVATVNATWDILGPRGLINSREREKAYLEKEISLRSLALSKDQADYFIRELYKKIQFYERQHVLLEASTANLQKNFDTLLDSYVTKKANLNDLRKALDELTESSNLFEQTKLEHIRSKILLAQVMGMEDLPGESFDKLTVGVKDR